MLSRPFPKIAFPLFALILAGSPTSSKLGGLAWLLLCATGCWAFLRTGFVHRSECALQVKKDTASDPHPVEEAAYIWLFACLAATILRIIPHTYWHDDWGRRHAEIRLLLGAMASAVLVKWPPFYQLTDTQKRTLGDALAMACVLGMLTTALYGRETPLHPIAWAVSFSFLVCLLTPMVQDPQISKGRRRMWAMAVLIGCIGVILSQSRGVYGLIIWIALACYVAVANRTLLEIANFRLRIMILAVFLFASFILSLSEPPAWLTTIFYRIAEVWVEASMSQSNPGEAANTSVGSRLFLWSKALDAIEVQPWLGYGKENSIAMIKQWGLEINSVQVQKLGHLHHEFLDAWVSHGLMGILSLLVLATGMGLVVRKLWVPHPRAAQGILGILFMHLTAGLSNTNMVHNYYGAMLSLSISLALVMAASEESPH